jgi:hypothetical protein
MLRERVLVQELQIALHRGWQLHTSLLRVMRAQLGRVLGWQRNQRLGSPN